MVYSLIYLPAYAVTNIALLLSLFRDTRIFARMLVIFFVFPVMCIGATRFTAPDYRTYARLYEQGGVDIFDPIFYSLMQVSSSFGLPLQGFLFLIFSVNIFLYWRVSKYFSVNFYVVLAIIFLHLFVTRDLSHIRVALAVALILYGYTKSNFKSYALYFLAAGIQFSSIFLIAALLYFRFLGSKQIGFKDVIIPIITIFLIANSLDALLFLDPRIELYMGWERDGYGLPLTSYTNLFFFLVLFLAHQYFVVQKQLKLDVFSYTFIMAAAAFVAFSSLAIFSFRLSNILISLYPFSVALCLQKRQQLDRFLYLLLLIGMFSFREGTWKVVDMIKVGFPQ